MKEENLLTNSFYEISYWLKDRQCFHINLFENLDMKFGRQNRNFHHEYLENLMLTRE